MSSSSLFSSVPTIHHARSQQDLSHLVKTSMNVGTLYPIDVQEIYPGDSMKVKTNIVTRLTSTFLRPVMDNLFLDVYHFFVPSRILFDDWSAIFGDNKKSAWATASDTSAPLLSSNLADRQVYPGSVADYMGLPLASAYNKSTIIARNVPINILPFRAFAKIYEDWFRDENNVLPMHIQTGPTASSERLNNNAWAPNNYMGRPPKVAKLHDLFTSSLPSPQKGTATLVPVNGGSVVPVTTSDNLHSMGALQLGHDSGTSVGIQNLTLYHGSSATTDGFAQIGFTQDTPAAHNYNINRSNLTVDLGSAGLGIGVTDLREAVQYQRMLERDARGGTRYIEYLRSAFGVASPDARLQRSEFLGGRRMPISITQVTQSTGADSETSPLGSVGGYSLSGGSTVYNKGFEEHGYVITVACIRQFHTYQQGVERFWTRSNRVDYYDPVFSNISEQPVYRSEIYACDASIGPGLERDIFGYQEAWYDLRNRPNRVSGQMRSGINHPLDIWHFADIYDSAPVLGQQFIEETPANVDRAISVESGIQDQFIADFYFKNRAFRVMPVRSIPGLVDHH